MGAGLIIQITTQLRRAVRIYNAFEDWRRESEEAFRTVSVGFVPTMGALHDGHASLIRRARHELGNGGHVVVSVYVNPTQFNDASDFALYPSTRESDVKIAQDAGADAVVFPRSDELYPKGIPARAEPVDYGTLTGHWEALHRVGHFDGVVAVVRSLFRLVEPERVYFGEKDWQQLAVISELVRREFFGLTVVPVPTVREYDGLAMSSRNIRIAPGDRKTAALLYGALCAVADAGGAQDSVDAQTAELLAKGWEMEYLAVVDAETLEDAVDSTRERRVLAAGFCGGVRLIDNLRVSG